MLPGHFIMLGVEQRLAQERKDAHQRAWEAAAETAPGYKRDVERDGILDDQLFGRLATKVDERALALIDAFARRRQRSRNACASLLVEGFRCDLEMVRSHQFGTLTGGRGCRLSGRRRRRNRQRGNRRSRRGGRAASTSTG